MTSVVDGEAKKQKGAINYDLFELKIDLSSELKSFVKDVPKFGVLSVVSTRLSSLIRKLTIVFFASRGVTPSFLFCGIGTCDSAFCTRLVLQCFFATDKTLRGV
jgi:hypothetical protein